MVKINQYLLHPDDKLDVELLELYEEIKLNPNSNTVQNDIKNAIFKNKIRTIKTVEEFNEIKDLYNIFTENFDKRCVLNWIGSVDDSLKERVLEWTLKDVELQDFVWALSSVASSSNNGWRLTFEFFKTNVSRFEERCGDALMLMQDTWLIGLRGA